MTARTRKVPPAPTAVERHARVLYGAMGVAALAFGLLCLGTYLEQAWRPAPTLSLLAFLLVFGLPLLIGVLSKWASLRLLRSLALADGVVFLAILAFWLVVRAEPLTTGASDIPWVISFTGIPAMAVAVATRDRIGWAYTALVCTASGLLRAATTTDPQPLLVGVEDGLYSLLMITVFVGLTGLTRRRAAQVDAAALFVGADQAARAAQVARQRVRLSIDALVHDSVISSLLMAGRGGIPAPTIARHAQTTLARLDAVRTPALNPGFRATGHELVDALEQLAADLAPDAAVHSDLSDNLRIPAVAVTALLDAVGEALRNSVAAAGRGQGRQVVRTVTVQGRRGGIRVLVHDDGAGFDPARVPAERLGITQSIIGRMERLTGGAAAVRSRPGAGTEVEVSWTPEPSPAAAPAPAASAALATLARTAPAAVLTRPEPTTPPAPTRLRPPTPVSLAIIALFILVHALLAFGDDEPGATLPGEVLGFLALVLAALIMARPDNNRMTRVRAGVVVALCALAGALVAFPMTPANPTPFGHWYLGAITLLLVVLAVRGRSDLAWLGYALMTVVAIVWCLVNGLPGVNGLEMVSRHAGTLLAGSLFALGMARSTQALSVLNGERALHSAAAATTVAAIEERESQLARVNVLSRPILDLLAQSTELGPELRAECLLVEATLRDAMRARALFVEPLVSATRAARLRGVEVTLLDDSGDHQPVQMSAVVAAVADELNVLVSGRLTARVLPADRPFIASIVIGAATPQMLMVTPEGLLQEA
ncbi:ATP-binding protein [Cryobacterium sp. TMT2-10]|uniref:ATP-binding protein n=1 Tax=unclassified Cryobacterium TaxID=2649013 RepID=UPI00106BB2C5|nr:MULTISPECIES: ATP-binding protein [unclassified Cryobacterium]TFC89810.1 ATP-binding protein [Cryobacterium sp. TmT2-59]TFD40326.1 ATP-binding protein [Cryobacterium sp. TMT2-10]